MKSGHSQLHARTAGRRGVCVQSVRSSINRLTYLRHRPIGSNLLKTVKRVMAGEYSRELSVKVFAGQCRLVELGFRQGGG